MKILQGEMGHVRDIRGGAMRSPILTSIISIMCIASALVVTSTFRLESNISVVVGFVFGAAMAFGVMAVHRRYE